MAKNEINMLEGNLWRPILKMALPLAATSILQQLFNSADVAVVGRFAGSAALAAVGANAPVISLFVNLVTGLSVGANVLIANAIGADDKKRISDGVHTSILLGLLIGIVVGILGFLGASTVLAWISIPEEIMDAATLYLKIYMCGMPLVMLYNFAAAVLRAKGDTRRPLMALLFSGAINLALNVFFVVVCGMNVEGVAIATVISNAVSTGILLVLLMREEGALRLELRKLKLYGHVLQEIVRVGLPTGIQGTMFAISNTVVQAGINALGAVVIAANAASVNYEYFGFYLISAFSATAVTYVGQNYGAQNAKRCRSAARWSIFMGTASMALYAVVCAAAAYPCMAFFTTEAAVVEIGVVRLRRILTLQWINAIMEIQSGVLRGLGKSLPPAVICAVGVCGFRIVWVYTIFQSLHTFECLIWAYPLSWLVSTVGISIVYFREMGRIA